MFSNVIFLDIPKTITLILFSNFSPYLKLRKLLFHTLQLKKGTFQGYNVMTLTQEEGTCKNDYLRQFLSK